MALPFGRICSSQCFSRISLKPIFHAGEGQHQRIFEAGPDPAQALACEAADKFLLVGIGRREQEPAQRLVEVRRVEWARTAGSSVRVSTLGSKPLHRIRRCLALFGRDVDDRGALGECELDDFRGAAAAARGAPVPHGDEQVAMGDRCPPGHDIGIDFAVAAAGQLEQAGRLFGQAVEIGARFVIGRLER